VAKTAVSAVTSLANLGTSQHVMTCHNGSYIHIYIAEMSRTLHVLGHVDDVDHVDHVDHDMLTLQCGSNLDQPGRVIGDEAPVSISVREPGLPLRHPTCYIFYDILYCKYGRKRLVR